MYIYIYIYISIENTSLLAPCETEAFAARPRTACAAQDSKAVTNEAASMQKEAMGGALSAATRTLENSLNDSHV